MEIDLKKVPSPDTRDPESLTASLHLKIGVGPNRKVVPSAPNTLQDGV